MSACIYCGSAGPFGKEHTLPRGFGEFKDGPALLDGVCITCNNTISGCEEQLCRSGVESLFREQLEVSGRRGHAKVNPFLRGSSGAQPIDFVALHPDIGYPVLWEFESGGAVREVRQLVLVPEKGEVKQLRISDRIETADDLRAKIKKLELGKLKAIHYFASDDEEEWVKCLVKPLGKTLTELPRDGPLIVKDPVATVSVTSKYFRAIAKVAFHHFLAITAKVTGREEGFAPIRKFIMEGGDVDRFVREERTSLIKYPSPNHRPNKVFHLVVAKWANGIVEGQMQLFLGPDFEPSLRRVFLSNSAAGFTEPAMAGTAFVYDDSVGEGLAGIASPVLSFPRSDFPEEMIILNS